MNAQTDLSPEERYRELEEQSERDMTELLKLIHAITSSEKEAALSQTNEKVRKFIESLRDEFQDVIIDGFLKIHPDVNKNIFEKL